MDTMPSSSSPARYGLRWRADRLADLMRRRGIHGRTQLARRIGIARATAYEVFEADWSGSVTTSVLAQLAGLLSVKPGALVEVVRVQ